jgi:hypothetical protein
VALPSVATRSTWRSNDDDEERLGLELRREGDADQSIAIRSLVKDGDHPRYRTQQHHAGPAAAEHLDDVTRSFRGASGAAYATSGYVTALVR